MNKLKHLLQGFFITFSRWNEYENGCRCNLLHGYKMITSIIFFDEMACFEKRSRKTLEKALLIYKGKEDELRLHLRREHLFGYDISKRKEVKAL